VNCELRIADCGLKGRRRARTRMALSFTLLSWLWFSVLAANPAIISSNQQSAIGNPKSSAPQSAIRNPQSSPPTVGMEGRLELTLPGTLLEARPVEPKTKIVLRIAESRPRGDGLWYDLRNIGQVPGNYDLRACLVRADGSPTNNLPPIPVTIAPLLPENHDGSLVELTASPLARLGGYKTVMLAVAIVWALSLIPLVWRRRKKIAQAAPPPRAPTLAERLRPLVEQAAAGTLSRDGQAQLERMLLNHWRHKLAIEDLDMPDALTRLKAHGEAGELLRSLENWLHRPPGTAPVDLAAVLAPYRQISVS
jgi:hypothetical protein